MAASWYEQRGAGVVSARRCEAGRGGCLPDALPGEAVRPWEQAYRCLERGDGPDTAGTSLISRGWSVEADG